MISFYGQALLSLSTELTFLSQSPGVSITLRLSTLFFFPRCHSFLAHRKAPIAFHLPFLSVAAISSLGEFWLSWEVSCVGTLV